MTEEERGWLRLHLTRGLGRAGMLRLMQAFGDAASILASEPRAWEQRAGIRRAVALGMPAADDPLLLQTGRLLEQLQVRLIPFGDQRYPSLLRHIHDPPALLYLRGELQAAEALAVVGSRRATEAGKSLTMEICAEIAARGITIVSGLARGIDTAAHRGALEGKGQTVAVLGCGIDRIYPPENARLFQSIVEHGAILSEYAPGTPPLAGHFPGRNRIISGLSRGVLVVEAAAESGSLITVDFALEQGREVFATPGPIFAVNSRGVNRLLKDGARLVTEARDILNVLWPGAPSSQDRVEQDGIAASLGKEALQVYLQLDRQPAHIDEIVRRSGLTPMDVSVILLHLELRGGIEQLPGKHFVRCRNSSSKGAH